MQRHFDAECPGRLQIDDELEFDRLQDRQVGGLRALQDVAGINADLTKHVRSIGCVTHQPADFDSLATGIARGNPVMRRKRTNWTRRLVKNTSPVMYRASARSRTRVAKAASIS